MCDGGLIYGFEKVFDVVDFRMLSIFLGFGIICLYMAPLTPTVMVTRDFIFHPFLL
jgi:hypothetical protein